MSRPPTAAFACLANCADQLAGPSSSFLAPTMTSRGRVLESELARRLGRERCWRVRWPDSEDAPCKDANETLMRHGADVVRECIERAEPYPIIGLHSLSIFSRTRWRSTATAARRPFNRMAEVDELMTIADGRDVGRDRYPDSGKANSLTRSRSTWRTLWLAVCVLQLRKPAGRPPAKLAEKYLGAAVLGWPAPAHDRG